jgi:hypothetical protein
MHTLRIWHLMLLVLLVAIGLWAVRPPPPYATLDLRQFVGAVAQAIWPLPLSPPPRIGRTPPRPIRPASQILINPSDPPGLAEPTTLATRQSEQMTDESRLQRLIYAYPSWFRRPPGTVVGRIPTTHRLPPPLTGEIVTVP